MTQELLGLHNLQNSQGAKKSKIRRGRGNSSGKGNYSGRGLKGQKARSGGKGGLKVRGLRSYLLRLPKNRGFKSANPEFLPINLDVLDKNFAANELVSLKTLIKKGLAASGEKNIKILGRGKINKALKINITNLSNSAKEAIIKAGGEIMEVKVKGVDVKKADNKTKENNK